MSNRRIAGNAAVVVLVVLALIAIAFWGGLHFGKGDDGDGTTGTEVAPAVQQQTPSLSPDRFSIVVEEDQIMVDGKVVALGDVVALAQKDGRPIRIFWKRARTGAESGLKEALSEAGLSYDEDSLD